MANHSWLSRCSKVRNEVLVALCYDHSPLILTFSRGRQEMGGFRKKSIKYELSGDLEKGCKKVIEEEWRKGDGTESSINRVQQLLSSCRSALSWWSRNLRREKEKSIKE